MIHARTKVVALIALATFLFSCVGYGVAFYVVQKHKVRLHDEEQRAAEADVQKRALIALEETVRTSADDRAQLAKYILPNENVIEFVSLLEKIAKEQGVAFETKGLETYPVDDWFEELEVTASIKGSFDAVIRMLRILETIPTQSSLTSVSLTRGGDSIWEASVQLRVTKYTGTAL